MVHEHFKISDTDGTVLDIPDLLIIELRVDSVQTFDTKWNETITATQKQPDEDLMDILHFQAVRGTWSPRTDVRLVYPGHGSKICTRELHPFDRMVSRLKFTQGKYVKEKTYLSLASPQESQLQYKQICAFVHAEEDSQGDDKKKTRRESESVSIATTLPRKEAGRRHHAISSSRKERNKFGQEVSQST